MSPGEIEAISGLKCVIEGDIEDWESLPAECVVLLIPKGERVGHYVAVRKLPGRLEYFDSFGVVPDETITRIVPDRVKVMYCVEQFQAFSSVNCGWWAMCFLKSGVPFEMWCDWFKSGNRENREYNDAVVNGLSTVLFPPVVGGSVSGKEGLIKERYYQTFHGPKKLYEALKHQGVKYKEIVDFLNKQQIQKITQKPQRSSADGWKHYKALQINQFHQADVMYMPEYKVTRGKKKGVTYKYVLGVIDIHTRYLAMRVLENLTAAEVLKKLKEIYKDDPVLKKPGELQTDEGKEFASEALEKWVEHNALPGHAHLIERVFRTIQEPLFKWMDVNYNKNWVGQLDTVVKDYNSSYHRTMKMSPLEAVKVCKKGDSVTKYYRRGDATPAKFKVGDKVLLNKTAKGRDALARRAVDFRYDSKEYTVKEVVEGDVAYYRLKEVEGVYYDRDLLAAPKEGKLDDAKWSKVFS